MKNKIRKPIEDIKKSIVKILLNSTGALKINTVSNNIFSNWLTTLKYCKELEKEKIVNIIYIEGTPVGITLNSDAYNFIDECLREIEVKEPDIFNGLIKHKRIIIGTKEEKE